MFTCLVNGFGRRRVRAHRGHRAVYHVGQVRLNHVRVRQRVRERVAQSVIGIVAVQAVGVAQASCEGRATAARLEQPRVPLLLDQVLNLALALHGASILDASLRIQLILHSAQLSIQVGQRIGVRLVIRS